MVLVASCVAPILLFVAMAGDTSARPLLQITVNIICMNIDWKRSRQNTDKSDKLKLLCGTTESIVEDASFRDLLL